MDDITCAWLLSNVIRSYDYCLIEGAFDIPCLSSEYLLSASSVFQTINAGAHCLYFLFQDGKQKQAVPVVQLNLIRLLADLSVSVNKWEVVDMILPHFIESLEEGDALAPSLLRLRVWNLVSSSCICFVISFYHLTVLYYVVTLLCIYSWELLSCKQTEVVFANISATRCNISHGLFGI